jgi:hypothetical protein
MRAILQPTLMAVGISALLAASNPNTKIKQSEYASLFPFWIGVVRPLGIFWNKVYTSLS